MSCGLSNAKKQEYSAKYSQTPIKIGLYGSTLVTLRAVRCCINN